MNVLTKQPVSPLLASLYHPKVWSDNAILQGRIKEAENRLESYETPNSKHEEWKYSRVGDWLKRTYKSERSNQSIDIKPFLIENLKANVLVFVNGYFRIDLSLIPYSQTGVIIQNMTEAIDLFSNDVETHFNQYLQPSYFADINTVYEGNGAFIKVEKNHIAEHPVHLLFLQTGTEVVANPRNLIILEKNAKLSVVESHFDLDASDCLTNLVSEWFLGENSTVNYSLYQTGTQNALIHTNAFNQKENSRLNSYAVCLNKQFIRNNHQAFINGSGTETRLNGAFLPEENQQIDNHTLLDHQQPHTFSQENYKGILFARSSAIFNGKIYVDRKAQQTNAFLNNSNLLLDDTARMDTKPELEIYADDVKCSHGSATGDLEDEAMFYLRSRGIGEDRARAMLIHAFLEEIVDQIPNEHVKKAMSSAIDERLIHL